MSSGRRSQEHLSDGVSMKLWHFCDILKDLNQLSIEKDFGVQKDHVYRKYIFFSVRIRDKMCFLRISIDGMSLKYVMTLFQELIPYGKKLFIYLPDLQSVIYWNLVYIKSFISWLSWTSVVAMFVIQRGIILEDGAEEIPTWKRFNGLRIVDEDAVQNEGEKRKVNNGLVDAPMKKVKLG